MQRLTKNIISNIKTLRREGKTYTEIRSELRLTINKSTLSYWCSSINLSDFHKIRIKNMNINNLKKAREQAFKVNENKRKLFLSKIDYANIKIAELINNENVAKIALAMLCLGEASKYGKSSFALGNTNPNIILSFLQLLKMLKEFDINKVRCTVQCRADQNIDELEKYWMDITNIPAKQFYKTQVDSRTFGKPTRKTDYKGVLRVNYLSTKTQLELESLSSLIYNILLKRGPVV